MAKWNAKHSNSERRHALGRSRGLDQQRLDIGCDQSVSLALQINHPWKRHVTDSVGYDFGGNWEHRIKVEKILPPDASLRHPLCLDGANACPGDDIGGAPGYEELLNALADPKHREREDILEWVATTSIPPPLALPAPISAFSALSSDRPDGVGMTLGQFIPNRQSNTVHSSLGIVRTE